MLTKLVWGLICVTPMVFSLTFVTAFAARASDGFEPSASPPAMEDDRTAAENIAAISAPISQTWTDGVAVNQWSVSSVMISEVNEIAGADDRVEHLQVNASDVDTSEINLEVARILAEDPLSDAAAIDFVSLSPAETMQLADADWSIAQVTPEPDESEPEPIPEEANELATPRWRFTFQPYGFVPLSVEGDATVRDLTADINLGLDDVLSPLNFAAAGRFEAWRGNLGFIFDAAYFSVEQNSSISRSGLDCLDCIFPIEIDTETKARYGQFDLGVGYRFTSVNPSEAATEFNLGPLVLDAIVGLRVYAFQAEIEVSTNLGTSRDRERSKTIVEPLISGRIRWNVSPNLAGWVRGDLAGLGIQGTVFAAAFTGGLEWMFSGNTSLLLAYRISSLQYTSDEDLELDLLLHGPYLGMVFRF